LSLGASVKCESSGLVGTKGELPAVDSGASATESFRAFLGETSWLCLPSIFDFPAENACAALLHTKKSFLIMDKVSDRLTSYASLP
jgi:hypothetical protein